MKARNNITGEIVDIEDMSVVTYQESDGTLVRTLIKNFTFLDAEKDYYTKLKHQYAGMAMQGMLAGNYYQGLSHDRVVEDAQYVAHALVEKYKENEKAMH